MLSDGSRAVFIFLFKNWRKYMFSINFSSSWVICRRVYFFIKVLIQEILNLIKDDMGLIPGRYANFKAKKMYSDFIMPTFRKYLMSFGFQSYVKGNTNSCLNQTICQNLLIAGSKFLMKMSAIFPPVNNSTIDLLLQRPDYYLGRIFAMFADKVSGINFRLDEGTPMILNKTLQMRIFDLIYFYFNKENVIYASAGKPPWCMYSAEEILSNFFLTFLEISKHSMVGTTTRTEAQFKDFEQRYINGSLFLGSQKTERPKHLANMPGVIPFCDVAPKLALYDMSMDQLSKCDYFNLTVTPKGLCYSFNSLSLNEIYKESNISDYWISMFEQQIYQSLINPSGFGPSNGLNFILNSFEHNLIASSSLLYERLSPNFILSISNEFNPYDVYKQNYFIEPGNIYTYRILANQITTTERFEDMEPASRNCSLPKESKNLNFTKSYSKSACEYECAVENAKKECSMIPWYIPRLENDKQRFATNYDKKCFDDAIAKFSTSECNCKSDCSGTSFSVFESRIPIENLYCIDTSTNRKLKEYPYSVLRNLCEKILRTHYLRFVYNHIVDSGPDPSNTEAFCNKLLRESASVVKVEMATKSLTRSLKDKRFNFVSQLSSLGKC